MMMNEITRPQAEALAALVKALRGWDEPGVLKQLAEVRARGTAYDVAHAALYAAEDAANRTPAIIALAGAHWTRGKALGEGGPVKTDTRCPKPEHEHEPRHNCRICQGNAKQGTGREPDIPVPRVSPERVAEIRAQHRPTAA